jgi:hypothetical protein
MGQSRTDNPDKTDNIGHTRHETRTHKTKKHNILCVGHPNTNTQTNTNNVNKTRSSHGIIINIYVFILILMFEYTIVLLQAF